MVDLLKGKMKDWQFPPKWISKNLPICPICKTRTDWDVYHKIGIASLAKYQFICSNCKAMWEIPCVGIKEVGALSGLTGLAIRVAKPETKELKLVEEGNHPEGKKWLNKSAKIEFWQQLASAGSFCGKCGTPLAQDEKFCPKCGAPRE